MPEWATNTAMSIYGEAANLYRQAAAMAGNPDDESEQNKRKTKADDTWAWAKRSEASARIDAMLKLVQSEPNIPISPTEIDKDP